MDADSTALPILRSLAARQGVTPTDEDLEAVRSFLDTVLPQLVEIERMHPPDAPPQGSEGR